MSTTVGKGSRIVGATMLGGPSVGCEVDRRVLVRVDAVLTFYGVWRGRPVEVEVVCDRYRSGGAGFESLSPWRYYVGRDREPRSVEGYRGAVVQMTDPMRAAFGEAVLEQAGDFLRDNMETPIARAVAFACRGRFNASGRRLTFLELQEIVKGCYQLLTFDDRCSLDSALEHMARMELALERIGRPL